ncbi:MAG TPA: ferrous iron transport protein A [Firmicutes bacterium]|nr:ferrous iron transport protein A [Bacillota bacterium]
MKLSELKKGETAIILNFEKISPTFSHRLYDVGISIGSEVTVLNKLNFGQLLHISIDAVEFCIRKKDGEKIIVEHV